MSLHQHLDLSPLLALLSEHLPTSLPTYNCLLCDDVPRVFASFAPGEEPVTPWVVLAELGTTQLRIFCSLESSSLPSEEELRTAAVLVGACVRDYARVAPEGLEGELPRSLKLVQLTDNTQRSSLVLSTSCGSR